MNIRSRIRPYWESFSYWGLVFAALFFSASLTPSLLPRHYVAQGLLSGTALALGYGTGIFAVWLWQYLEFHEPSEQLDRLAKRVTGVVVTIDVIFFLWRATVWQNSIRELMEMSPLKTAYPLRVALIAIVVGAFLIAVGRLIGKSISYAAKKINRILPRRIANVLGVVVIGFVLLVIADDIFARMALLAADSIFARVDKLVDDDIERPSDPITTGSEASLVAWESIGRQGKHFLVRCPTKESIGEFLGREAKQPVRVYVGYRTKDSPEARAKLALEELKRAGGFKQSVLVVATPTGTGWLDPGAVDTIEYMHGGDTAIVSIQYSYLPSWITILIDPDRSRASARALFNEVYTYWKTLPKDNRPKLYLHGLSLGSFGSEGCAKLLNIFEDPIHGGLWSGPPFPSATWGAVTDARQPDSPEWLPRFQDGRLVRFTAQKNSATQAERNWGPLRFVYIQYASDPMVFFSPSLLFQKPEWLEGERGPDVSPELRWYPLVTFLQIAFDLPMATSVPLGYGHNYSPTNYIEGWVEVTDPPNWTEDDTQRLQKLFSEMDLGGPL